MKRYPYPGTLSHFERLDQKDADKRERKPMKHVLTSVIKSGSFDLTGEYVGREPHHDWHTYSRLMVGGRNVAGYYVGFIPPDRMDRKVQGGPLEAGPWAYAFPICGVIDNHGGTRTEIERAKLAGLLVTAELGDTVVIEGNEYRIEAAGKWDRDNIRLTPVK